MKKEKSLVKFENNKRFAKDFIQRRYFGSPCFGILFKRRMEIVANVFMPEVVPGNKNKISEPIGT